MIKGLSQNQAQEALRKYGPNVLPEKEGESVLKILLRQFNNPLILLLVGATILSFVIGDRLDAFLIGAILIFNAILGFWQEYKASKELEALRKFQLAAARVIRNGQEIEIDSGAVVPGDVVVLEPGDMIPADGKVVESYSLQVNESALSGESLPIIKSTAEGDNLVYFGTAVSSGRAKIEVLQTGLRTKFGMIASDLAQIEAEKTPLEKALASLSRWIGIGAIVMALLVFISSQSLLGSIALMVAVVPEGLPAVVTLVLAIGVRRMYRKKALIRKMIAVESLGAATVILTDKTGTLTKNEMKVIEVKGKTEELLECAVLCNSASLVLKEDGFDILGDTTEGALLIWAKEKGKDIDFIKNEGKLVEEIPFNLETRKMTVFWQKGSDRTEYSKGAPEVFNLQSKWEHEYKKMAARGLRVLAFSKDNKFLGLVGIADEVRPEVKEAIRVSCQAGIKVVMVTGDNELTAKAVGEEIGLLREGDEIITGAQLNELDEEDLLKRIGKIKIFARITPNDKLRIVKTYQKLGEVVAVTGDGVNDVLALKQAEVGVAMGKIGTDVSKEASDIVLLDDNFATLITAVEQGRLIYANILKVVKFLLTGNLSEALLIGLAVVAGSPTPLLPTQILWINFVTDGFPALSLGFDSASGQVMRNPPRKTSSFLTSSTIKFMILGGVIISTFCLAIFYLSWHFWGLEVGRSSVFTAMVVSQMVLPFIMRRHHSILSNKKLFASVIFVLVMQVLILTLPPLKTLFKI